MKTIRMPKELLDKWLAALRSGEYKQAHSVLHDLTDGGYCCLGVLQMVADGRVEVDEEAGGPEALPSLAWLRERGITFMLSTNFEYKAPRLPAFGMCASSANDDGRTFAEIADAIEACAEGY